MSAEDLPSADALADYVDAARQLEREEAAHEEALRHNLLLRRAVSERPASPEERKAAVARGAAVWADVGSAEAQISTPAPEPEEG